MQIEHSTQPSSGDTKPVKGLTSLMDIPQLYHGRDASMDTAPWRVKDIEPEKLDNNVFSGVFYLTPFLEEAAHHVRDAALPTIHKLDITDNSAKVMNGDNFDLAFAATLKNSIDEVLGVPDKLHEVARDRIRLADEAEYTYNGAAYSLESNIKEFAAKTLPEATDLKQWERAIETYVSAINAQRLLLSGNAHLILQGALDYTINPSKSFVFAEIGQSKDGQSIKNWFTVNRKYLLGVLTENRIVGLTRTINRFGTSTGNSGSMSVVFNDAVMLWSTDAIQTSGPIDQEKTVRLIHAARELGKIPIKVTEEKS